MPDNNTIFLVIQQGFTTRYLLQTDIFKILKKAKLRVVILIPNSHEEYFLREFGDKNVYIEKFEYEKCLSYLKRSKIQRIIRHIRWLTLNCAYDIQTTKIHHKVHKRMLKYFGLKRRIRAGLCDPIIWLLRHFKIFRMILIYFESKFYVGHFHRELFKKYKPTLVITTSLGYFDFDQLIMREARLHGVQVVSIILSWDNTSSKGMAGAFSDYVVAWTKNMKKELIQLHDIDDKKIFVGGVAHYDHYYREDSFMSRKKLFDKYGLSMERKLIFFGTKSPNGYPWNPEIIKIIGSAIEKDLFAFPCQLLVRIHPIHFIFKDGQRRYNSALEEYEKLKGKYPFVFYNYPNIMSKDMPFDMPKSEIIELSSILKYSNILINMVSTLMLEGCIFQVPIINVCFFGRVIIDDIETSREPTLTDILYTHNQRIIKTGGVKNAYSVDELIEYINMYLENPELHYKEREYIKEQECGPYPGCAGETVGRHILDLLASTK